MKTVLTADEVSALIVHNHFYYLETKEEDGSISTTELDSDDDGDFVIVAMYAHSFAWLKGAGYI